MNSFGRIFRVSIFGESHGEKVGVTLDGVPPGIPLTEESFAHDLQRRKSGGKGTTPRKESDKPHIVSGIFNDRTTGAPLTVLFDNENTLSGDYSDFAAHPRPSHADWTASQKYKGFQDYRGGGHFSGRLTLGLVAAGVVAKKILKNVKFTTNLIELDGHTDPTEYDKVVEQAVKDLDSVGGVIECVIEGAGVGLGEPFFDSVESVMGHLIFSVPAVKGVEFGAGFEAARLRGSENNDPIISPDGKTVTNNAGGIAGGITNGNPIVVRAAVKPTPSIASPQITLDMGTGKPEKLEIRGRHDACIALRAGVVIEAAAAISLCDLTLLARSQGF